MNKGDMITFGLAGTKKTVSAMVDDPGRKFGLAAAEAKAHLGIVGNADWSDTATGNTVTEEMDLADIPSREGKARVEGYPVWTAA